MSTVEIDWSFNHGVYVSSSLCSQLLRPRCCRCEVSSTGGHCYPPRLVNISFSTSCPRPLHLQIMFAAFTVLSLLRRSWLSVAVNEIRREVQSATLMGSITFLHFWSSSFLFFHNMPQTSNLIKLLHKFTPIFYNVAIWPFCVFL